MVSEPSTERPIPMKCYGFVTKEAAKVSLGWRVQPVSAVISNISRGETSQNDPLYQSIQCFLVGAFTH